MERLPYSLRQKWRETAVSITVREKRDANLKDMTEFVEARSRVANDPIFGKIADSKLQSQGNNQRPIRRGGRTFASEASKPQYVHQQATQNSNNQVKCHSCHKEHWLSQCNDFKKLKCLNVTSL